MRWLCLLAATAATLSAQLTAPNESGVSTGHIHLIASDPDAQRKLFVDLLGGEIKHAGPLDADNLLAVTQTYAPAVRRLDAEYSAENKNWAPGYASDTLCDLCTALAEKSTKDQPKDAGDALLGANANGANASTFS